MADLLMIVPTRGRPNNVWELWGAWKETANGAADLCFAVDDDDPELDAYRATFRSMATDDPGNPEPEPWVASGGEKSGFYVKIGPRERMVGTLNTTALHWSDRYRYLGFMGDDHRPRTSGWDQRFCECLSGGTGIVYGNDLLQGPEMPTAVAMTSDIVRALGYMAPPAMVHLCVDLCWKDWGQGLGRLTYLNDVILEHMHPANGKAPYDAGYEDANSPERTTADATAYLAYRDQGSLSTDLEKLRALL